LAVARHDLVVNPIASHRQLLEAWASGSLPAKIGPKKRSAFEKAATTVLRAIFVVEAIPEILE
jgi:hypothetical protein